MPGLLLFLALTTTTAPTPAPVPIPVAPGAGARLEALAEESWSRYLELHPRLATAVGDDRFGDRFGDGISADWRRRMERLARSVVDAARALDPEALETEEDRWTRRILIEWMTTELEALAFPEHLLVVDHRPTSPPLAFARELGVVGGAGPRSAADYDALLDRMAGFAEWVEVAVSALRDGAGRGIVPSCAVVAETLAALDRAVAEGVDGGGFLAPVESFPAAIGAEDRERLRIEWARAVEHRVAPAYRELRRALAEVTLPACRSDPALAALPNGAEWYRTRARRITTSAASPVALFQLGLAECRRAAGELAALEARQARRGRSLEGAVLHGPREVVAAFEAIGRQVERRLPLAFGRPPRAALRVVAVERRVGARGERVALALEEHGEAVVGTLEVDLSDPAFPAAAMESTFLRQGLPGRYLERALAVGDRSLPAFRRHRIEPAFTDGWALYAAGLGDLLGLYGDPVQEAGALRTRLEHAARLVADAAIHGLGWPPERVGEILRDVAPELDPERTIRAVAVAGDGLAPTVGERTIARLRERAHGELEGAFDLRAFHDEVLRHGAVPLPVLAEIVERWVEARRPPPVQPSGRQ